MICQKKEPNHDPNRTVFKEVMSSFVNHKPHHLMTFLEQKGKQKKPPPLARATAKSQNLSETTPTVALTQRIYKRAKQDTVPKVT